MGHQTSGVWLALTQESYPLLGRSGHMDRRMLIFDAEERNEKLFQAMESLGSFLDLGLKHQKSTFINPQS